ncbi:MAG: thioesterase family protein [Planctomycetaceae bacterium]
MKETPRIGASFEKPFTVESLHAMQFSVNGAPPVLSTPWLIWFVEHAALEAAAPFLEPGEFTVGTHIDIEHLAPTPVGGHVVCKARIIHADGKAITYQIEASDDQETICRGTHKRRAVRVEKFAARVAQKAAAKTS